MRIIKDITGQEWKIDLNISTAKLLSNYLLSLDPPVDLFDASQFMPRASSILFAVDVLAILTYDERKERDISDYDFGTLLKGGLAYEAQQALLSEYVDFFPDPQIARSLKSSLERLLESAKKEQAIVEKVLEQAIQQREEQVSQLTSSLGLDT